MIGVIVGHLLENSFCSYENPEHYLRKGIVAGVGMVILLMVQFLLQSILPVRQSLLYLFMMYVILGVQITYIFPVLVKLFFKKKVEKHALTK